MPEYIDAYGFILLRVSGQCCYFGFPGCSCQRKIAIGFSRIIAAAFFGVAFNMLTFFKPNFTNLGIRDNGHNAHDCILSNRKNACKTHGYRYNSQISGTAFLILYGRSIGTATNASLGNILVFVNAVSYGFYLITVKKING
jgi:drug/metabolite transporter (DMT)-like permease